MTTTGIPVHAQRFDPNLNELCHASWACELASVISDLWLLFVVGIFTLVLLAALSNLRAGTNMIEEEQSRTAAERDAFLAFAERVGKLSPDTGAPAGVASGSTVASAVTIAGPSRSRAKVREAYRETVMAVPHFEQDYGESLEENMAVELGEDVAVSIVDGQGFSPILQQLLVSKARAAAAEREQLIGQLEREAEELSSARDTLSETTSELEDFEIPTRLDGLAHQWDRLDEFEDRCNDVTQTRQRSLVSTRDDGQPDTPTLSEYLYGTLSVDYPVLADCVAVLEQIEDARQAVVSAAVRCA